MIFEKITEQEKELIDAYIQAYEDVSLVYSKPLDYRLRYWNRNKKDLFELFGQQLILKKTVSIEKPSEQVDDEMERLKNRLELLFKVTLNRRYTRLSNDISRLLTSENLLNNIYFGETFQIYDLTIHKGSKLTDSILEIAKRFEITIPSDIIEKSISKREDDLIYIEDFFTKSFLEKISFIERGLADKILYSLISCESLRDNTYFGETFYLPSRLKIQKGCKTMKALLKVAKEFGITIEPDIISKHSEILNQKKITGTLCLSIHPLDFLTMSDNKCGWSSCFSIAKEGDYRAGTISLMNSPLAIVAYLESSTPMDIPYGSWSNKRWREVFVISKDIMSGVKGYPYKDEPLEDIILQWLKELSPIKFSEPKYIDVNYSSQEEEYVYYQTGNCYAYNDFPDLTRTVTSDTFISGSEIYFMGENVCISCGEESIGILCDSCSNTCHCSVCGDRLSSNGSALTGPDEDYYCEFCFGNTFSQCQVCEGTRRIEDFRTVSLESSSDCVELCDCCYSRIPEEAFSEEGEDLIIEELCPSFLKDSFRL